VRCFAANETESRQQRKPEATSPNSGTEHCGTSTDKVSETETTDTQRALGGKLSAL